MTIAQGQPLNFTPRLIGDMFGATAALYADRPAFDFLGRVTTFGELAQAVITCGDGACCQGTGCYCGDPIDLLACATAPAGACIPEIEAAAGEGVTGLLGIATPAADPSTALGAATALGVCLTGNPMPSTGGAPIEGKCTAECTDAACGP